jgi:hypothetical protein
MHKMNAQWGSPTCVAMRQLVSSDSLNGFPLNFVLRVYTELNLGSYRLVCDSGPCLTTAFCEPNIDNASNLPRLLDQISINKLKFCS